jgi:hypothetical protein
VKFWDYEFEVLDNNIIFDEELTAKQLGISPGDGFISFVQENGTVVLRKIDLSKVENIELTNIEE